MNSETNFRISCICMKFTLVAMWHYKMLKCFWKMKLCLEEFGLKKMVLRHVKEKVGTLANLIKEICGETIKEQNPLIAD